MIYTHSALWYSEYFLFIPVILKFPFLFKERKQYIEMKAPPDFFRKKRIFLT